MEKNPPLDADLVKTFVIAAHGDLDKVKSMLRDQPALLNVAWDWGGGDFETALAGAAHMGNRSIALYLLDNGAHMTIYAAAMLGELDLVKAMIQTQPHAHKFPGAHGIPLLVHAQQGGEAAVPVVRYLESLD